MWDADEITEEQAYDFCEWWMIEEAVDGCLYDCDDLNNYLAEKPKSFRDYKTNYDLIKCFRYPIKFLSKMCNLLNENSIYVTIGDSSWLVKKEES